MKTNISAGAGFLNETVILRKTKKSFIKQKHLIFGDYYFTIMLQYLNITNLKS